MDYKTDRLAIRDSDGDLRNKLKAITLKKTHGRTSSEVVRRLVDSLYMELYNDKEPQWVLSYASSKTKEGQSGE